MVKLMHKAVHHKWIFKNGEATNDIIVTGLRTTIPPGLQEYLPGHEEQGEPLLPFSLSFF